MCIVCILFCICSTQLDFYLLQDTQFLLTGGVEKLLRIYDLNRPDAPPRELDKSPGSVRTATWLHSDQTILSSCTDMGGVRFAYLVHPLYSGLNVTSILYTYILIWSYSCFVLCCGTFYHLKKVFSLYIFSPHFLPH